MDNNNNVYQIQTGKPYTKEEPEQPIREVIESLTKRANLIRHIVVAYITKDGMAHVEFDQGLSEWDYRALSSYINTPQEAMESEEED